MSDVLDFDYLADDETSVALDESGEKFSGRQDNWFKMAEKGKIARVAFLSFQEVHRNAVFHYRNDNDRANAKAPHSELERVARQAREAKAAKEGKSWEDLSPIQRLDLDEIRFNAVKYYYKDGLGYVTRPRNDGKENDALWASLGEEKQQFTSVILIYPADAKGEIPKDQEARNTWIQERLPREYRIQPIKLNTKNLEVLLGLNASLVSNNTSLAMQDVKLTCTDAKYKAFTASSLGPALWRKSPKFSQRIVEEAMAEYETIAKPYRELTSAQLKAKLREIGSEVGGAGTPGGTTASINVNDYVQDA